MTKFLIFYKRYLRYVLFGVAGVTTVIILFVLFSVDAVSATLLYKTETTDSGALHTLLNALMWLVGILVTVMMFVFGISIADKRAMRKERDDMAKKTSDKVEHLATLQAEQTSNLNNLIKLFGEMGLLVNKHEAFYNKLVVLHPLNHEGQDIGE